jgi:hypothetical protein
LANDQPNFWARQISIRFGDAQGNKGTIRLSMVSPFARLLAGRWRTIPRFFISHRIGILLQGLRGNTNARQHKQLVDIVTQSARVCSPQFGGVRHMNL